MVREQKLKLYFLIAFIVMFLISFLALNSIKNNNINKYLKNEAKLEYLNYQVIYNNFKNISELIFKTHIQNEKILNLFANRKREELKNYLTENYNKLRVFNLRQLHFHLPNNDSFLRMHRPNKFGDNLTKDRKTVAFVNEHKKYIHGFEEGKIFNGFRFVYPLSLNNKHIGSVEISFSALFFIREIAKNYKIKANFLIKKDVVDKKVFKEEKKNYIQSPLKPYYYQKSIYELSSLNKYDKKLPKQLENKVLRNMEKGEVFSIYVEELDEIATFIPLINPLTKANVAFLKMNKKDRKISEINKDFYNYLLLLTLLIIFVLIYLYSQINYQKSLEEKVDEKTNSLNKLNKNLEVTIEKEVAKNRKKDELMIAQSRHAAMGEMISMIAHQWRQPLTTISMDVNNILADIELDSIDEQELKKISEDIIERTQYMSKTIDDFRNFFRPEKATELINLQDLIKNTISITRSSLENHDIKLEIDCKAVIEIETYSRELLQVLINIVKNAKESFEKNTNNRYIKIYCKEKNDFVQINIENNGSKIPENIIEKIFEPYFTTKDKNVGTGLGLYMSKIIVEKHLNGKIEAQNLEEAVRFSINLPFKISN